jgi:signal transduction histidine kinase
MLHHISLLQNLFKTSSGLAGHLEPDKQIVEKYFISYSLICITLLLVFAALNAATSFYVAFWIDVLGIFFYLGGLFLYRKSLNINKACGILIFTCCLILFFQSIILEPDAYHNMFFFPTVAVFCFALFTSKKYTIFFFTLTCISAVASYFVPKHFPTTLWYLTASEKGIFTIASVVASLVATYKIGAVLYIQKAEAYQKLNAAHMELEKLNQKNRKLLQLIIHDISNPLQLIDLVMDSAHMSEKEKILKLNTLCRPAVSTIKDIIDISRQMLALEDGKIVSHLQEVDLKEILTESEAIFIDEIRKKNIHINRSFNPERSYKVMADPKSLRASVINNILSNAIKFSHRNSEIILDISENESTFTLKVRDTGIGIPEVLMKKLFSAEETTSRYGTDGEKGTGYGLALAKTFMTSYGGKITCESSDDSGTTFSLTFLKENNPHRNSINSSHSSMV